jgi:peptide/nickel transport system ATP-binding protein
MPLLEIRDLTLDFISSQVRLRALDNLSLSLDCGETLCLVGESGCGKTVTALSITRLLASPPARYVAGQVLVDGRDVLKMHKKELRVLRGGTISYVFQEPGASLNPVMSVGAQIRESLKLHQPQKARPADVIRLLQMVGITAPESRMRAFPFLLSGGMQQRAMIAMALAAEPRLLVADEPTTALDVTIQAQILELLRALQKRLGMAILLITHNLGLVSEIAHRVAVMYAGQIVEEGQSEQLLRRPFHPYTRALIASVPVLGQGVSRLAAIPGTVPPLDQLPAGCRFAPRCPIARSDCLESMPSLLQVEPGRFVRCPYWAQSAVSHHRGGNLPP